jgi:phosphatidylinositol glycan class W
MVAASLATYRSRTDFPSDYLTSLLPLLLGQTLFSHHPLAFNAALLAISVLLAYASPRGPLRSSPTLGEQQSTSRQPDGSARPAHVEADSSSDDEAPIAAKAVPLPPKADTTLRRRKEVFAANTADRKPSPSPLLDLPTESERTSPFDGLPQRSPPHSLSISPDTRDHAIDIAASPTAAQGFFQPGPRYPTRTSTFSDDQRVKFPQQPFLSVYRAHMMIMTVVAILAVDFPIFPREFGKCEDWGTSLVSRPVVSSPLCFV